MYFVLGWHKYSENQISYELACLLREFEKQHFNLLKEYDNQKCDVFTVGKQIFYKTAELTRKQWSYFKRFCCENDFSAEEWIMSFHVATLCYAVGIMLICSAKNGEDSHKARTDIAGFILDMINEVFGVDLCDLDRRGKISVVEVEDGIF